MAEETPARLDEGETFPWNQRGYGNSAYRTYGVGVTVEGETDPTDHDRTGDEEAG